MRKLKTFMVFNSFDEFKIELINNLMKLFQFYVRVSLFVNAFMKDMKGK